MFKKIKTKIIEALLSKSDMIVPANSYAELVTRKFEPTKIGELLTKEQLTMKQLGSYIPNFIVLNSKSEQFKVELGQICKTLINSEHFKYLMEHLKQDQVNNLLFQEKKPTDDWVRGSINGIYVVEDIIKQLGISAQENTPKKKKQDKTSP